MVLTFVKKYYNKFNDIFKIHPSELKLEIKFKPALQKQSLFCLFDPIYMQKVKKKIIFLLNSSVSG